jgi:hypothetical protein
MCPIFVDRQGIDYATAAERPAPLPGEPRLGLDVADPQRMIAAAQHAGFEQGGDVARPYIPIGNAAAVDVYLDKRFQPGGASRAISNEFDSGSASLVTGFAVARNFECDRVGAHRDRRRLARHIHAYTLHETVS